jgi:TRAP-type C4-dicarboxylate transport system permease small subunit
MNSLVIEEAAAIIQAPTLPSPSRRKLWTGRVLAGLPLLFLTWDAVVKLAAIPQVVEASAKLGYAKATLPVLGTLELVAVVLTLFRRTRVFGAVLLTAYLGGAVETHVRLGDPLLTHTLFPIYFAALIWGGLSLIDTRIRAASPFAS